MSPKGYRYRSARVACIWPMVALAMAAALTAAHPAAAQIGLQELIARLGGENVPNGAGVAAGQVEAPDGSGNYRPNPGHAEFVGKTFTLMSGASGNSNHATTVGRNFYGLSSSVAPGVADIFCWEANNWVGQGYLRLGQGAGVQPLASPGGLKVKNHSWIGSSPSNAEILRRADFAIARDDLLMINGVNNGSGSVQNPLLSNLYNGIAVGRSNGEHSSGNTTVDIANRMKPEIVAPHTATSWATGLVSGAAALLVETARTPPLADDPLAERSEVIKAVLLAGAKRGPSWTNNPIQDGIGRGITSTPLDNVFGAGEANVNTSHLILTAGRHPGAAAVPASPTIAGPGWDFVTLGGDASAYWRFNVAETIETVSVLATWHRAVSATNMNSWSVADFSLYLWRVQDGNLVQLFGDPGLPYFTGGNVVSNSDIDNVELLLIRNLQPAEYVLELQRFDFVGGTRTAAIAWLLPELGEPGIPGDLDGDGDVDVFDLLILLGQWGPCGAEECTGDLNGSGAVDVFDLLILLGNWG
jgi:hypothetical protein